MTQPKCQHVFTMEGQLAFARLSGDTNPLHIDKTLARRYLFGEPVVHGIHILFRGLDFWLDQHRQPVLLHSLNVSFNRPLGLDEPVHYSCSGGSTGPVEILVEGRDSQASFISIEAANPKQEHTSSLRDGAAADSAPPSEPPRELSPDEIASDSGALPLHCPVAALASLFPRVAAGLPTLQIAVILATTRLVGTRCPGLNSIYSELELSLCPADEGSALDYDVVKFDRRFGLTVMQVRAPGLTGRVKAFIRPAPKRQAAYEDIRQLVNKDEFVGQRALVIGGSRGLGEVTAKLICAGGGRARITYHQGQDDARHVVNEITGHAGKADCIAYDALDPESALWQLDEQRWQPTHVYYFATPFIAPGVAGAYSTELFERFCDYYVRGFRTCADYMIARGVTRFIYPSTTFLDDPPGNMAEYARAKSAGEALCAHIESVHPDVRILLPRLPRLATDQTASLLSTASGDPAPRLLLELRLLRDAL